MSRRLPPLKPREVLRALQRAGFFIHHASGSHYVLKHPDKPQLRVTVAHHNKELKRKTLASIIEQAGFTLRNLSACCKTSDCVHEMRKLLVVFIGSFLDAMLPVPTLKIATPSQNEHALDRLTDELANRRNSVNSTPKLPTFSSPLVPARSRRNLGFRKMPADSSLGTNHLAAKRPVRSFAKKIAPALFPFSFL